jgi:hypothetical protein
MFALSICFCLIQTKHWSWVCIHSEILSESYREQRTRHETWPTAQALLVICTEALGRFLPAIAYLVPSCQPLFTALMMGCTALAVRVPPAFSSRKCDSARSLNDAAQG